MPRMTLLRRLALASLLAGAAVCAGLVALELPRHHSPGGWLHLYRATTPVEQQWPSLRSMPEEADD